MNVLTMALLLSVFAPTLGIESTVPTIFQQVRIGNGALIPNTAMSPPVALVHPDPEYTVEALEARIEGTVTVRAEFDIDGNFEVLGVVKHLGYGLDEAALAALESWQFRPAYRSGRRVAVVANVDVVFRNPRNEFMRLFEEAYSRRQQEQEEIRLRWERGMEVLRSRNSSTSP